MDNNIKVILAKRDIYIPGYGTIKEGYAFQVVKANSRYVYIKVSQYTTIRLARKKDCIVVL